MGTSGRVDLKDRLTCIELVTEAVAAGARKSRACDILGLNLRTLERWERTPNQGDQRSGPKTSPKALTVEEKMEILMIANRDEFKDLNPHKIVAKLADAGRYVASESSFYRVLRNEDLLTHRSKSRPRENHPPRCLVANAPNQVWSWDITYLASLINGKFYYLYMIEDIFSRAIVGWRVEECESAHYSAEIIDQSCQEQNVKKDQISLHSDNGKPMKGATMLATLQRLGVTPSFSRPSVSNDNPFSESLFRTLKYVPMFPTRPFANLDEARTWVAKFVNWYNTEHLHSEIRYVTPQSRHRGLDGEILSRRVQVYQEAKTRNPIRWSGETRNWSRISEVILNPGKEKKISSEMLRIQAA